jgi:hypothetical protein
MANIKDSHIPVFLKDTNELRNPISVRIVGMHSPFPVVCFETTQFTLDYYAISVHNVDKPSHIPVPLQNIQS